MKTSLCQTSRKIKRERGFAVIVVLGLSIVIGILLVGNSRALADLKRNLRRIEEKQIQRPGVLNTNAVGKTNVVLQPKPGKP